jgi:hypothetical protein
MNQYAFDLDLPCIFLNEKFNYKKIRTPHLKTNIEKSLSSDCLIFFDTLGLKVTSTELFYKTPSDSIEYIHIDDFDCVDRARLNYLIEDNNSMLYFYKPKRSDAGHRGTNATGGKPIRYNLDEVELVYQHRIGRPSVIQSELPHAVFNPNGIRYNLAVYLSDKTSGKKISFLDAFERFSNFIV